MILLPMLKACNSNTPSQALGCYCPLNLPVYIIICTISANIVYHPSHVSSFSIRNFWGRTAFGQVPIATAVETANTGIIGAGSLLGCSGTCI
jgi:hypothetical protein